MIINEKVFLCYTLFIITADCLRSNSRGYSQQEHFEYYNPQNGFPYGFGRRQGEVHVPSLNRQPRFQQPMQYEPRQGNVQMTNGNRPRVQQVQERRDPWPSQGSPTFSPSRQQQTTSTTPKYMNDEDNWGFPSSATTPPTTPSTTTQRFLPHSPIRWRDGSSSSENPSTSTRRSYRKHRLQDEPDSDAYDSNKVIINGRDKALVHIGANLQPYFLRALVRDFISKLSATVQVNNVLLGPHEITTIDNQCSTCTVPELQTLLNILLTIMEKYPPLIGEKALSEHVATEYERAYDFLSRKLDQLKNDLVGLRQDNEFRDLQKRYVRRERKGGIMSFLLKWIEEFARTGHDNEQELEDSLLKLLTKQKRFWLISIRGIL